MEAVVIRIVSVHQVRHPSNEEEQALSEDRPMAVEITPELYRQLQPLLPPHVPVFIIHPRPFLSAMRNFPQEATLSTRVFLAQLSREMSEISASSVFSAALLGGGIASFFRPELFGDVLPAAIVTVAAQVAIANDSGPYRLERSASVGLMSAGIFSFFYCRDSQARTAGAGSFMAGLSLMMYRSGGGDRQRVTTYIGHMKLDGEVVEATVALSGVGENNRLNGIVNRLRQFLPVAVCFLRGFSGQPTGPDSGGESTVAAGRASEDHTVAAARASEDHSQFNVNGFLNRLRGFFRFSGGPGSGGEGQTTGGSVGEVAATPND